MMTVVASKQRTMATATATAAAAGVGVAGIKVLDFSRILAAPLASQILGDLGADVWKVERPGKYKVHTHIVEVEICSRDGSRLVSHFYTRNLVWF